MKNKMKNKIFFLIIIIINILLLKFNIINAKENNDIIYNKIIKNNKIIIGISPDYAPYEFEINKNKIVGIDTLIAKKISKDLKVNLQFKKMTFDSLLMALKTNKIDIIISAMEKTKSRTKEVDFSIPYLKTNSVLLINKLNYYNFNNIKNLKNKKIGVQLQSSQEILAKKKFNINNILSLQKIPDLIMNLKLNKIDAVILDNLVANLYKNHNKNFTISKINIKNNNKNNVIIIPKNSKILKKKINNSIKYIKKNKLLNKYKYKTYNILLKNKNKNFFKKYSSFYIIGLYYTIIISIISLFFGIIIGLLLTIMKLSKYNFLIFLSKIFIEYIRGTPLIIQIFIVYFGFSSFGLHFSKVFSGCIALTLNSSAYISEIFKVGINSVNKNIIESAISLGMNKYKILLFIIFPIAIKKILPALNNEFVTVIKESSTASIIGVTELIFQTTNIQGACFKPFLPYFITSIIYLILTLIISKIFKKFERI